jgi:hypothetical protein
MARRRTAHVGTMEELRIRVYENGGRKRADTYSHWALAAIRTSIHYLLGQKMFDLGLDEDGEDLVLVPHEALPRDVRGLLFRIYPFKTYSYEWPEYVQLHVLDATSRKTIVSAHQTLGSIQGLCTSSHSFPCAKK